MTRRVAGWVWVCEIPGMRWVLATGPARLVKDRHGRWWLSTPGRTGTDLGPTLREAMAPRRAASPRPTHREDTTMTPTPQTDHKIALGDTLTVNCVTNYTEHTGPVIDLTPCGWYSDGTVMTYRVTIQAEDLSRPVIGWAPLHHAQVADPAFRYGVTK